MTPEEAADIEFGQGRSLSAIGTFWEETEKLQGRPPTWEELEPILCRALDVERDKYICTQRYDDRPIGGLHD